MSEINHLALVNSKIASPFTNCGRFQFYLFINLIVLILFLLVSAPVFSADQETFATPEDAVNALSSALQDEKIDKLLKIFGSEYKDALIGGDPAAARVNRNQVAEAIRTHYEIRKDDDGNLILIIGPKAWPLPFPLVKEGKLWQFDTAAGIEEIVNRRIGANELNAIAMCHSYIEAQQDYASKDRDGDKVFEYAQQIISTPGEQDGLYWKEEEGQDISPFGPLVADAKDYLKGHNPGDPYKGYYFKILTRQSENPPGGRYDYIINGNMIAGFALISFPADYGNSGIMSFICNQQGVIFQADLGDDTNFIAGGMDVYNPDDTWTLVKDP